LYNKSLRFWCKSNNPGTKISTCTLPNFPIQILLLELASAAKDAGVGLGFYLSRWDRHEACYGDTLRYNEFYLAQMTELLTRYGEIKDIFLDGTKGDGETEMNYLFDSWISLIHQLQPGATNFSDLGPDTRWIGNEYGAAGSTCWSLYNKTGCEIGYIDSQYNSEGDQFCPDWIPATCDVSIRPSWFWHASEQPKSARSLLESIRGGIQETHFSPYNVLEEGIYTYWAPGENQTKWILYIDLQELVSFNILQLQEPINMGQRVIEFHLEALSLDGVWMRVVYGTTIGYQRLLRFPKLKSQYLKLVVDKLRRPVDIFGIYMDPVTVLSDLSDRKSGACFNGGQVLQTTRNSSYLSATM
ncbi:Putative alpha-L-fucosidase 1, partial [Glycine soja]